MARCSAGPKNAGCTIECPKGCGCIYEWETGDCLCNCYNGGDENGGISGGKYNLGSVISISVSGLRLRQVASLLDRRLVREVLVPASRVNDKVNLRVKRASFSTVIRTLGLGTRTRVKRSRASKR